MKHASRWLLPLELLLGILLVSWALAGWLGRGPLWNTLHENGLNAEWGAVLCGVGTAQFAVAFLEWFRGRRWAPAMLLASVTTRCWIAFAAGIIWVYVLYLMATLLGSKVISLAIQAPAALVFSAWVFLENRKTACLLDPKVPTSRLQSQILAERESSIRGF